METNSLLCDRIGEVNCLDILAKCLYEAYLKSIDPMVEVQYLKPLIILKKEVSAKLLGCKRISQHTDR